MLIGCWACFGATSLDGGLWRGWFGALLRECMTHRAPRCGMLRLLGLLIDFPFCFSLLRLVLHVLPAPSAHESGAKTK